MDSIRARHDVSLAAITEAIRKTPQATTGQLTIRVNSTVPGFRGPVLKPDIQVYDDANRTAVITDLAIAYEEHASDDSDASAFEKIKRTKVSKYAPLKDHLERQGYTVHLSALVYGSLGSVAPANQGIYMEQLGLLKRDARRLKYRLSTDHIKASKRIWARHTLRQGTPAPTTNQANQASHRQQQQASAPANQRTQPRQPTNQVQGWDRRPRSGLGGDRRPPRRPTTTTRPSSAPQPRQPTRATTNGRRDESSRAARGIGSSRVTATSSTHQRRSTNRRGAQPRG